MEISEILEAFHIYDGQYKREHVDAAIEMQEEIAPHLIAILEAVLSDPTLYMGDSGLFDHTYAIMLLGYFREARAHDTIVRLFSLPDEIPDDLFGDIVTEDLPLILYRTCNDSLDRIRELALNREANEYCRSAALDAMSYAMLDGLTSREETLDFFGSLFTGDEAEPNSFFWGGLTSLICKLHPEELMPVIEKGFEDELIDLLFIDEEDVQMALERSKEETLKQAQEDFQRKMSQDVHEQIAWWACFDQPVSIVQPESTVHRIPPSPVKTKKKAKTKKRKKMAKASRRKNRKKRR